MFDGIRILHGTYQCCQGLKDDFAELNPEKENKKENGTGRKKKYEGADGKFGSHQGGIIPDK
jgi:hypothetical protein